MSTEISWVLQVAIKSGSQDDFTLLAKEMVESTQAEEGALGYEYFIDDEGTNVHIHERYTDSDAAMAHMGNFGKNFAGRWVKLVDMKGVAVYGSPSDELKGALDVMGPVYLGPLAGFTR